MGRVLLAYLSYNALDEFLQKAILRPITPNTITDAQHLRELLKEVRRQGWAMVDQELEEGLRSIAAPIFDRRGNILAALNVSTHASRITIQQLQQDFLPMLLQTARNISLELPT